jgi:hypothetical protein
LSKDTRSEDSFADRVKHCLLEFGIHYACDEYGIYLKDNSLYPDYLPNDAHICEKLQVCGWVCLLPKGNTCIHPICLFCIHDWESADSLYQSSSKIDLKWRN